MNVRLVMSLVVALALAAIALGCGGGDSTSSAGGTNSGGAGQSERTADDDAQSGGPPVTTSSLSKVAFIKEASAACNRERKESLKTLGAYLEKHGSKGSPEAVLIANGFKAAVLPGVEEEIAAIRKLGAPAGDEEEIEAMLAAQQAAVDEVMEQEKVKSSGAFEDYFADAGELYREYGLNACALSS